jgi:hypothetical protein
MSFSLSQISTVGQGLSGAASGIGGAVSDLFSAQNDQTTAQGETAAAGLFGQAATQAAQNAAIAESSGKFQQVQTARQLSLTQGAATAYTAGGGLLLRGSAASILRSNAQQGAVAQQEIGMQTGINVNSYLEQSEADKAEQAQALAAAQAAEAAAKSSGLGAIFSGLKGIASLGLGVAGLFTGGATEPAALALGAADNPELGGAAPAGGLT